MSQGRSSKYIVVFKEHATREQIQQHVEAVNSSGGRVNHRYDTVLKGFSADMTEKHFSDLQTRLTNEGLIDYIEPDALVMTQKQ